MAHLQAAAEKKIRAAVVKYLTLHKAQGDLPVISVVLAGQLAFFCENCGDSRTYDRIAAEAVHVEKH